MSQDWSLSNSDRMRLNRALGRETEPGELSADEAAQETSHETSASEPHIDAVQFNVQQDLLQKRMRSVEQENRLGIDRLSADLSNRFNQLSMDSYDKIALLDRNQGTIQKHMKNLFDISATLIDEVESVRTELKETQQELDKVRRQSSGLATELPASAPAPTPPNPQEVGVIPKISEAVEDEAVEPIEVETPEAIKMSEIVESVNIEAPEAIEMPESVETIEVEAPEAIEISETVEPVAVPAATQAVDSTKEYEVLIAAKPSQDI